ncbi:hypothetical protein PsYK624_040970 [Phanerochaete sordida]|uniref:Uncharacterized protein n=1 Tax=Phanerochaete sordida TaxID=48140 RepID=A0A9P3LAY9_9APHY|nr:hypothetical protein PsYK624_040970 [Phanerochaete sordida]
MGCLVDMMAMAPYPTYWPQAIARTSIPVGTCSRGRRVTCRDPVLRQAYALLAHPSARGPCMIIVISGLDAIVAYIYAVLTRLAVSEVPLSGSALKTVSSSSALPRAAPNLAREIDPLDSSSLLSSKRNPAKTSWDICRVWQPIIYTGIPHMEPSERASLRVPRCMLRIALNTPSMWP